MTTDADGDGRFVAIVRDISAQLEFEHRLLDAKKQADQASQAKSEFLANISHEIRTPMTAILGYTDILSEDGLDDPRQARDAARTIKSNSAHLLTIINDILDVSKIEAGQMTVEAISVRPEEIVEEAVALVGPRARAKGFAVRVEYANAIPKAIESDPTRLRQVLLNLLGNAIKFTEQGGITLLVSYDPPSTRLAFSVIDTGIGMTPEQCEKIARFDAFVQADASTVRKHGGTGLGLRISNAIAQMLGGTLSVSSRAGGGSTFTVTIATGCDANTPLVEPIAPGAPTDAGDDERAGTSHASKPLQGARIVLAEDGPDNQRLVSFHLRRAGAEVVVCENGLVACEHIESATDHERPCIVLMDMQMPELDGYGATRRLREGGCRIPIVALTAHAMEGDRERCLASGCDDYATKPIDKQGLIEKCAFWIAESRQRLRAA